MWPVPLVTAGLVGDLPGHGIILTTWNPAPEPPEGLDAEGKGLPETMPMARTCYAAAAAVRTISTLACGTCASVTSKFVNWSWSWDKLVIHWDKRGSARCRVFSGLHSGARTVREHQGIVLYCGSSIRGGHCVTRGQIMLWTGVQYCLHCLRTSRNHWGRTRTMTFFVDNMYWTLKIQTRVLNKIAYIWVELNLEYFSSIWCFLF